MDDLEAFNAAKFLSIIAYPARKDLVIDGRANRFASALLAHAFRCARRLKKIQCLPPWVASIPVQQMSNRIRMGFRRLHYAQTAYMTFVDAEMALAEQESAAIGATPGFLIRQSLDFSGLEITFLEHTRTLLPVLWHQAEQATAPSVRRSPRVGDLRGSLRASILRHREAFGVGRADDEETYRNIYQRYMKPIFGVVHLVSELHAQSFEYGEKASELKRNLYEYMLMNPDWISGSIERTRQARFLTVTRLRRLGVPACDCQLIGFERRKSIEISNIPEPP